MTNEHDKRYKKLFSHPVLVQELLEHFVHEDFIKRLNFSTLERLDKSFVTDRFREKESDLIYKIQFNNTDIYIYLLIEFQSTVDRFMALRMLRYICEFYEYVTQTKVKKLPPVFPLMLYNGDAAWTAPLSFRDLVEQHIPEQYIPEFKYYPLIENTISKATLRGIKNAVSAIFYVENNNFETIKKNFRIIINLLQKEKPGIIVLFKNWLNDLMDYRDETINQALEEIQGVHTMSKFTASIQEFKEKIEKKGIQKGIKQGKQQGKQQGMQQGRQQGMLQGKQEVARNMLSLGYSVRDICAVTGLSEEEIKQLNAN